MPRLVNKPPSYRLHRSDGRAVVTLDGRDNFLGKYGTPESRAEYDRLVGEWLANGRRSGGQNEVAPTDLSVNEVLLAFWRHAERHYRKPDGTPSGELDNYRDSLRDLKRLYGGTVARDFSPLKLKAVRQGMIDSGLSRTTVNQRVGRIVPRLQVGGVGGAGPRGGPPVPQDGVGTPEGPLRGEGVSVSVWEGATLSGQGVPPEWLRRESFECVSRAGERAWSFAQTMVGSGSRCVGTCGIDRCRQAGSVLPVSATGRARWAR